MQATLLLPLEAQPANDVITTEFLKDHVAFWDGNSRNDAPVVTLSGLRGTMTEYVFHGFWPQDMLLTILDAK